MVKFDINLIRKGDIIQFHTKGFWNFISKGIRQLTKSYWNHAGIVFRGLDGQLYVIEALGRGVAINLLSNYVDNSKYDLRAVRPNITKKQIQDVIKNVRLYIGSKYDFTAIIYLGFRYIFGWVPLPKSKNPLQQRVKFFCSELICRGFTLSGLLYFFAGKKYPKAECGVITPKDMGKSENVKYVCGLEKE